jgi:hypothetical protein
MRFKIFSLILIALIFIQIMPVNSQSFGKSRSKATKTTKLKKESIPRAKKEKIVSNELSGTTVTKSKEKTSTTKTKEKGMMSKMKDAAARGYGWQLGKEAARETIKGAKKVKDKIMNNEEAK